MAMDNRGWYRDWVRKKTGYVERSAFRLPASESEFKRPFKLHPVWVGLAWVGAVFVAWAILKIARFIVM